MADFLRTGLTESLTDAGCTAGRLAVSCALVWLHASNPAASRKYTHSLPIMVKLKHHIQSIFHLSEAKRIDDVKGAHDHPEAPDQQGNAARPGKGAEQKQEAENGENETDEKDEGPAPASDPQRNGGEHFDHAGQKEPTADKK